MNAQNGSKNRVVVITGGSSGLGKALAMEFKKAGAKVIISFNNRTELKSAAKEIGILALAGDVSREKDIADLAGLTLKKFRRLDVWVNNAGITFPNLNIKKLDLAKVRRTMDINFFGTLLGSLQALAIMKKQKSGAIVNVISVRALSEHIRFGVYSASKWASRGFTEALQKFPKPKEKIIILKSPPKFSKLA